MTNNTFISLAFVTITLAAGTALAASGEVRIDTGKLRGVTAEGVTSFKCIPYAGRPGSVEGAHRPGGGDGGGAEEVAGVKGVEEVSLVTIGTSSAPAFKGFVAESPRLVSS
jgi:hypothetical protein